MEDKIDMQKVLGIVDDTSKVEPMSVLDGLSNNWNSKDTVAMTLTVTEDTTVSPMNHPGYAFVEISVVVVIFLTAFLYSK